MTEIQRADPKSRRQVLLIVLVGTLIGTALILAFEQYRPELGRWLEDSPLESRTRLGVLFAAMAILGCLPLLGMAIYLWFWGDRIIRAQRFPPPGTLVVRDTAVVRDRAAVRRGRIIKAIAAVFAVAALGFLFALWRLWTLLPA